MHPRPRTGKTHATLPSLASNKSVPNLKKPLARAPASSSLNAAQPLPARPKWKDSLDQILGDFQTSSPPGPSCSQVALAQDPRVRVRRDNFFVENMKDVFIEDLPSDKVARLNEARRQHLRDRYKSVVSLRSPGRSLAEKESVPDEGHKTKRPEYLPDGLRALRL